MNLHPLLTDQPTHQSYKHLFQHGRERGHTIGLEGFDELISFKRKSTFYVYGPPYSGKSTFCDILMGLLDYQEGSIKINGDIALKIRFQS